jgi:hypothetical protein
MKYDYEIRNMAVDLRDGIRLGKVMEYLLWSRHIEALLLSPSGPSVTLSNDLDLQSQTTTEKNNLSSLKPLSSSSSSSSSSSLPSLSSVSRGHLLSICSRMQFLENRIPNMKHNNSVLLGAMERLMYSGLGSRLDKASSGLFSSGFSDLNVLRWVQPLDLENGHRQKTIATVWKILCFFNCWDDLLEESTVLKEVDEIITLRKKKENNQEFNSSGNIGSLSRSFLSYPETKANTIGKQNNGRKDTGMKQRNTISSLLSPTSYHGSLSPSFLVKSVDSSILSTRTVSVPSLPTIDFPISSSLYFAIIGWCDAILLPYGIKLVNISSSSSSLLPLSTFFSNGSAFCCLLHSYLPDSLNIKKVNFFCNNIKKVVPINAGNSSLLSPVSPHPTIFVDSSMIENNFLIFFQAMYKIGGFPDVGLKFY